MSLRHECEDGMSQSHYAVLGIQINASADEIKTAYRTLAQKYHPDRAGDSSEARTNFEAIQHAMSVLLDDQKRREYDIALEGE